MEAGLPDAGAIVGGRYRVVRAIGHGGMGVVFEAEDTLLGRRVALKILRRAELDEEPQLARFEREARAVARLNDPNVVGVSDFVHDAAWGPAMVLELLVGESLGDRLQRAPPLSEPEIVDIAVQALGALERAHAAGMVHRDLKPSNLFLVTLGSGLVVTKLLDFGIVKLLDEGVPKLTQPGAAIGTPAYMPAEQALGGVVDARTDVYAMGALLYEALSGKLPYGYGDPLRIIGHILTGPPDPLDVIAPHVSPELVAIVTHAMAHQPDARFASAAEMQRALRSVRLLPSGWRERDTASPVPVPVDRRHSAAPTRVSGRRPETPPGATTSGALPLSRAPWLVAGVLAIAIVGGLVIWSLAPRAHPHGPVPQATPAPPSIAPGALDVPAPSALPPSAPPTVPTGIDPPPSAPPPASRLLPHPAHRPPLTETTPVEARPPALDDHPLDPFGSR